MGRTVRPRVFPEQLSLDLQVRCAPEHPPREVLLILWADKDSVVRKAAKNLVGQCYNCAISILPLSESTSLLDAEIAVAKTRRSEIRLVVDFERREKELLPKFEQFAKCDWLTGVTVFSHGAVFVEDEDFRLSLQRCYPDRHTCLRKEAESGATAKTFFIVRKELLTLLRAKLTK